MDQQPHVSQESRPFPEQYHALTSDVRKAIELLRVHRERALAGAFRHGYNDCPIHKVYLVTATSSWWDLESEDRDTLSTAGWTGSIYHAFLSWYDKDETGEFLFSWVMSQEILPQTA